MTRKATAALPKKLSAGEEAFALHCRAVGLTPLREFTFCAGRRWRFDFAWADSKLAVEIEGGTWSGGRHTSGAGYAKDLEKYNRAVLLGWRVLRFTTAMVLSGEAILQTQEALT
jgi:very-short-patch-repair endonuclease